MYKTHCVPRNGYKMTIPVPPENGPSRGYIPISFKPKDETNCCKFISDFALILIYVYKKNH